MADINLLDLIERYNCDDKCRDTPELLRWPSGVCCTHCGDMDVIELEKQNRWQCGGCRYQFSVTSGTIMHDSHLPLRKWFLAIYLMVESKKGMSANQLIRELQNVHGRKTARLGCDGLAVRRIPDTDTDD